MVAMKKRLDASGITGYGPQSFGIRGENLVQALQEIV